MAKLKVKLLKLSAGRPVIILNKEFAENSSINVDDRVYVHKNGTKIAAVVDLASGLLKKNEAIVSTEISSSIKLKRGDIISIDHTVRPESLDLIRKKLQCKALSKSEIQEIVEDIVKNNLTEAEIAYFISAVYKCGMSIREVADMIKAIVNTGAKIKLKGKVVDKHSIGGIPGRTTPIIVSICSSLGLLMPKTSSRAITTAAGTADAMEVICKVNLTTQEIKKVLRKTNACLVWGGSLNLAPADDKLIQIERLLNLDPEAQMLSSIIAKKVAVDAKYILIDIPYGKNAKVTKKEAIILKRKFLELGKYFNLKLECSLKEISEPLGNGIGPALEIEDVIKVLKRKDSCHHLESRSLELSGKLLELAGKAKPGLGFLLAKKILDSGIAYKKFLQIVKAQHGNINKAGKRAKYFYNIRAERNGKIVDIKIKDLNTIARTSGCPSDKKSGIYLHKHLFSRVKKGDLLLTIYSESRTELKEAVKYYKELKPIKI